MAHLIDKDALVADIEKLKDNAHNGVSYHQSRQNIGLENELSTWEHLESAFATVLKIINTLEVKEVDTEQLDKLLNWWKEVTSDYSAYKVKDVDLEKEVELWMQGKPNTNFEWGNVADAMRDCAKHFFELGIKVKDK